MQDTLGKDVDFYPIHRSLLDSYDDTTFFMSSGKISTNSKDNKMPVS